MTRSAENDPPGCHPLLVCTDRPELCPPACKPVVRNAGANQPQRLTCNRTYCTSPGLGKCRAWCRCRCHIPPAVTDGEVDR